TGLLVQGDGLDVLRLRQRGEDHVAALGDGPGRVGPAGTGLDVRLGGLAPDVVNHQLVAGLLEIGRHVAAHGSEPDESDLHDFAPSKTFLARRPAVMAVGHPAYRAMWVMTSPISSRVTPLACARSMCPVSW